MLWDATRLSLQALAIAIPVIFFAGLAFALLLARRRFPLKSIVETILLLPLVLPPSVIGYLLLRILGRGGPLVEWFGINILFTWPAIAVASTVVGLPLMIQTARVGIEAVDPAIEDAARVDGASRLRVILTMTLPLARRGILAGLALGSVRALGEFGATLSVAGNIPGRTQNLPLAIYDAMQRSDFALANQIAALMIGLGFLTIWFTRRASEQRE